MNKPIKNNPSEYEKKKRRQLERQVAETAVAITKSRLWDYVVRNEVDKRNND